MAVGLILLMVAHNSEMLAASSPKIAHLLDLCRKVPQVVACVGKIKEQVRHDVRWVLFTNYSALTELSYKNNIM